MSKFTGATPYEYRVRRSENAEYQKPLTHKPPLTLAVAERVCRTARCASCGGNLMIDRSEDPLSLGSVHCMACGHDIADVKEGS